MLHCPHVALLIETSKAYGRGLLRGIGRYVRACGPWSIYIEERGVEDPAPGWLKTWGGDGIIARIRDKAMARALLATRLPVVDVRQQVANPRISSVYCDDTAIGRLAVAHFVERGFRHFAYCGRPAVPWSERRCEAYCRSLQERGFSCRVYEPTRRRSRATWEHEQEDAAQWVRSLPKPVAVLACHDMRGLQVLDACRRMDVPVPEEVAVLGVDNDVVLCELADPPLSSVDQHLQRMGYEAAALLDRLMGGEAPAEQVVRVKPVGIAVRQSTDIVAIEDVAVARALRFIRLQACDHIEVDEVAAQAGISRRGLERRFRALVGHTPLEEIHRVQLDRIKHMLMDTDAKLASIVQKAGFQHLGHMSSFFKAKVGMTLGQYRKTRRAEAGQEEKNS
jgi:LacI family transcriptional regulator